MNISTSSITTTTADSAWNGPVCSTCGARWLGSHTCSHEDIVRRINELLALLKPRPVRAVEHPGFSMPDHDPMRHCPCRVENGGSGVCGCVLSGPTITCAESPHASSL